MKTKHYSIGLVIGISSWMACGTPQGPGTHEHDGHVDTVVTEMVGSERWQANPETTSGIRAMQVLLETPPGPGDTLLLRDALEEEFGLILERCTMKGEAHERLHDYLLPLLTMIRELPDQPSAADRERIRHYLAEYDGKFR